VLTVVLRHRYAQRRLSRVEGGERRLSGESGESGNSEEIPMEQDEVEAMVTGVKSHGGRDLLKYVKGLLG